MTQGLTQEQRDALWDQLDRLPEPYGYTITAHDNGTYTLTCGGKKGHTKGRPKMTSRGSWEDIVRDARDYVRLVEMRREWEAQVSA